MPDEEITLPEETVETKAETASHSAAFKILMSLMLVLFIAAVTVSLAIIQPWRSSSSNAPSFAYSAAFTLGQANAPVTIDLYEDFQCPICRDWSQIVFSPLKAGAIAAGEVKLVFHGLSALGPESAAADRAAFAAAQQGRFWDMWAALYAHQGETENSGAFSDLNLRQLAVDLGLDLTRYDADFISTTAQTYVTDEAAHGHAIGIAGTPTLIIAGVQYPGITTYEILKPIIDAARK